MEMKEEGYYCEDTFAEALQGGIKDSAKVAKKSRRNKKSSFIMRYEEFLYLIKTEGQSRQSHQLEEACDCACDYSTEVNGALSAMHGAFEALAESHEDYVVLVDEAIIDAESDYIEERNSPIVFSRTGDL